MVINVQCTSFITIWNDKKMLFALARLVLAFGLFLGFFWPSEGLRPSSGQKNPKNSPQVKTTRLQQKNFLSFLMLILSCISRRYIPYVLYYNHVLFFKFISNEAMTYISSMFIFISVKKWSHVLQLHQCFSYLSKKWHPCLILQPCLVFGSGEYFSNKYGEVGTLRRLIGRPSRQLVIDQKLSESLIPCESLINRPTFSIWVAYSMCVFY